MDEARRGDNLVGRIASEVQKPEGPDDLQRQGPDMDVGQEPVELRIVEAEIDALNLRKPREFPEVDGGYSPTGAENPISRAVTSPSSRGSGRECQD